MAPKAKKATKATKKDKKTGIAKKVNTSLINASIAAINTTVENAEKWQKLGSKLIKKSEKVREQQINMVFDTAEAVKGQVITGTDRVKDLVGYDTELVDKAKDIAMNNPVSRKVAGIVADINEKVSKNPIVQKAEKATEDMKHMGMAKFNELKGDAIEKASKIVSKAEHKLEDAKKELKKEAKKATKKAAKTNPKKTTSAVKAKGAAKVAQAKATTAAKKTIAKSKVKAQVATKEVTPAQAKKVVAKKVSEIEAKGDAKLNEVKAEVKETIKTSAKDDLKLIYGIGPKTEIALNKNGIKTYVAFSKLETSEVESILEKEGVIFADAEVKDWKKQSEVAVKDGSEGLVKWVERYRTA
jgi:predicted flap endonuclease-1-like 5' DNA nuclease